MLVKAVMDSVADEIRRRSLHQATQGLIEGRISGSLENNEKLNKLSHELSNKQLALILGAGVSKNCGIPDWNTLMSRMLLDNANILADEDYGLSQRLILSEDFIINNPLIAGRSLFLSKKGVQSDIKDKLKENIYKNIDIVSENAFFLGLASLANFQSDNHLSRIVTYNYDDILETYLAKSKIPYKLMNQGEFGIDGQISEIPIYHVHGFLPQRNNSDVIIDPVFGESDYHKQYVEQLNWNNSIQIETFRKYTCLIIGHSFRDPNLRLLLDKAKNDTLKIKTHYLVRRKPNYQEIRNRLLKMLHEELKNNSGPIDLNLDQIVKRHIEFMTRFFEEDARSFNVEIIWVDEYITGIPLILREIIKSKDLENKMDPQPRSRAKRGEVKFYNRTKNFGFISGDDGHDYFVHGTGLLPGISLTEGDKVIFDVVEGEKGPKADKVDRCI